MACSVRERAVPVPLQIRKVVEEGLVELRVAIGKEPILGEAAERPIGTMTGVGETEGSGSSGEPTAVFRVLSLIR